MRRHRILGALSSIFLLLWLESEGIKIVETGTEVWDLLQEVAYRYSSLHITGVGLVEPGWANQKNSYLLSNCVLFFSSPRPIPNYFPLQNKQLDNRSFQFHLLDLVPSSPNMDIVCHAPDSWLLSFLAHPWVGLRLIDLGPPITLRPWFCHLVHHGAPSYYVHSRLHGVRTPFWWSVRRHPRPPVQGKDWLSTGLVDEITALCPTEGDVNPQTGEHDKDHFTANCLLLFPRGRLFASE
jgi:hypothetical protein